MIKVGKEYRFEAAHHLPNHKGKCAQPHGHSYRLIVEVEGEPNPNPVASDRGMVIDFGDLDAVVHPDIIGILDHMDLNTIAISFGVGPCPTVEVITSFVVRVLTRVYGPNDSIRLSRVRLYETAKCYAEWTP